MDPQFRMQLESTYEALESGKMKPWARPTLDIWIRYVKLTSAIWAT
jgi:hypothetical protein